ncbi:MAG: hypothetical protein C5B59_10635 [Bacteroidetes bacterium]|nr:MAG: hypothetical protein C5B59_10635 [Bacteroidota bacterium]
MKKKKVNSVTFEKVLKKFRAYEMKRAGGNRAIQATFDYYKPSKKLSEKKRKYFYLRFTNAPDIKYDPETDKFIETF